MPTAKGLTREEWRKRLKAEGWIRSDRSHAGPVRRTSVHVERWYSPDGTACSLSAAKRMLKSRDRRHALARLIGTATTLRDLVRNGMPVEPEHLADLSVAVDMMEKC